jgi:hypothetical protein
MLSKLEVPPGLVNDGSYYSTLGRWNDGNRVRFRMGKPETIRGWEAVSNATFLGTCRALRAESLYDAVAAYVATQDADTQNAWEYAVEIRRDDALIGRAAAEMGKSDAEVDDLFRLAATL